MTECEKMRFEIKMHTPIGIKIGKMYFENTKENVSGFLDILNHIEPFIGTVNSDGSYTVQGNIVTLMKTVCYTAHGYIKDGSLHMEVSCGKNKFFITGSLIL